MVMKIFDFLAAMESELARLYRQCRDLEGLAAHREQLERLEALAADHARLVTGMRSIFARPELEHARFLNLHGQVRHAVPETVKNAPGTAAQLEELGRTQERFGVLYRFLADHFREMASYYTTLAGEIDTLSNDEYRERDELMAAADRTR